MSREGLVRLCSEKYEKNRNNVKNKFAHLTNFAVNKKNNLKKKDIKRSFKEV